MKWEPIIQSRMIRMDHFLDTKFGFGEVGYDHVLVTEVREGYHNLVKYYWVHCGSLLNVIVNGDILIGQECEKYRTNIFKAIELFQLNGISREKVIQYPPVEGGDFFNKPAVMYDSSSYHILKIGDLLDLEKCLKGNIFTKNNITDGSLLFEPKLQNICILPLPIDQELINNLWKNKSNALKTFIDNSMKALLE